MALLFQAAVSVISLWILIQQSDSITLTANNSYDGDNTFEEGSAVTFSCKIFPYTGKQQWKIGTTKVAECGPHSRRQTCTTVGKRNRLFSFQSDTSKGEFSWTINPIKMEHNSTVFKCSDGIEARIITAVVLPLECKTCHYLVKAEVAIAVILLVHIAICIFTKISRHEKEFLLPAAAIVYELMKRLYITDQLAWCHRCGDNSRYLPTIFVVSGIVVALLDLYFLTWRPLPARPVDKWKIDRDLLTIENTTLGRGRFGEVRRGKLRRHSKFVTVAVKFPTEGEDLHHEADILKKLSHDNVILLYGVSKRRGKFCIVMEIMDSNLLDYLQHNRDDMRLPDQLNFTKQIINAMVYLSSENILHLDLAARNVLVKNGRCLKISDFGLAWESSEIHDQPDRISSRALTPERFLSKACSEKTDVWSFGLLLFEIVTGGGDPFQGVDGEADLNKMILDNSLPCRLVLRSPAGCPPQLFDIILQCTNYGPHNRPAFNNLRTMIDDLGN